MGSHHRGVARVEVTADGQGEGIKSGKRVTVTASMRQSIVARFVAS